jgi:hypothetical protein
MFASDPDSPQNIITQTIVAVIGAMNELEIGLTKERQKKAVKMAKGRRITQKGINLLLQENLNG